MPNGTLYDLLHSSPRSPGWPRRLRLTLQTAWALRALHDTDPPVIRRNITSANILDANLNARLDDFGLARKGMVASLFALPIAGGKQRPEGPTLVMRGRARALLEIASSLLVALTSLFVYFALARGRSPADSLTEVAFVLT